MYNQYAAPVFKDQYGAVDVNYYAQQASEMRSEYLLSGFKSLYQHVKNAICAVKRINLSPANILHFRKIAK